jgi:hypothetical protein
VRSEWLKPEESILRVSIGGAILRFSSRLHGSTNDYTANMTNRPTLQLANDRRAGSCQRAASSIAPVGQAKPAHVGFADAIEYPQAQGWTINTAGSANGGRTP